MPADKPQAPLDDIHSVLEAVEAICATFEDCTGRSNFGGHNERGYVRIVDMGD